VSAITEVTVAAFATMEIIYHTEQYSAVAFHEAFKVES
jgi:hypothetical protein